MTRAKIAAIRSWIARREARGVHPNADEIWSHIRSVWPRLGEDQHEAIFQGAGR